MQNLWFFVENAANAVTTVFTHDRVVIRFSVLLNDMADIAQRDARLHQIYCLVQTFL